MTKFECAQEIVKTLTPDQIRKLAAKQVASMMKSKFFPATTSQVVTPGILIDNALNGIRRMDRIQLDFAQAWDDHNNKI